MKKIVKVFMVLIALIAIVFGGLTLLVGAVDANKYRPQLVKILSEKTGRVVKLNGPIAFSLGLGGLRISIQDGSISNPSWASRPLLAGMGKFELGIGIWPLLDRRLSIHKLLIENADILLETSESGQHNWDFTETPPAAPAAPAPEAKSAKAPAPSSSASRVFLSIDSLKLINSQLAMRGANKKVSSANIAFLDLENSVTGAQLSLVGDINGAPLMVGVKTSLVDLLSKEAFSFDADATFNLFHVSAQGKADIGGEKADIAAYEMSAGTTKITGSLSAAWGGPRPALRGTLNSDHIDPADFKTSNMPAEEKDNEKEAAPASPPSAPVETRIFSDALLPFDALTSVDANLDVVIGEVPFGKDALKQITAKLALSNGNLFLAPIKASIGASPFDAQVILNAAQAPARVTAGIIANTLDLEDLQKLAGIPAFMTGKAGVNIQLSGEGNTAHEIASSLGGVVTVTTEKGEILTGAAARISSTFAAVFNPAGETNALNCMAARFNVKNGVMSDNGILVDSAATTVAGYGIIDLGSETINMMLRAKTKLIDVGGIVPVLQISGGLSNPRYSVDTAGMVKNVVGALASGNITIMKSGVSEIQADPSGKNACVYTLDHPKKATSTDVIVPGTSQKIKDIGNSVIKGLFGQ